MLQLCHMELNDLNPIIPYKIKSLKKFLNLFHSPSGQDVLSSPQWTRHGPLLANGAGPVSARHPGSSFPVHHPEEAVPKLTNDNLFPSLPWSAPFAVHKNGGPAGDTIFWCVPEFSYSFVMMFNAETWAYVSDWKRGSTGWFIFQFL